MVNNMAAGDGRARLKIYKEDNGLLHVSEFLVTPTTKGKDVVNRLQRHVHGGCCYLVEVWQGCERLVGDDENLLGTLLDWAEDLDEVRFHLVHKEQVPGNQLNSVTGPTIKSVNGFGHQLSPSSEVVLGGSRMTVDELRSLAARQQQEIALKEKELRAKDEQLKKLKQEERVRRSANARSKYLQELEAQAEVQNQRLKKLREDQKEADKYSIRNIYLAEELEHARQVFASKQSELAMAVARVECLTKQLENRKKGLSTLPQRESQQASMSNEVGQLEKELLTRNELNHQQSVQLLAQKQLLAEKHKELFDLDSQIYELTNEIRQKRSNGESLDNSRTFSAVSPGSATKDIDSHDFTFEEYDDTATDTQWEINCDLLDIPAIELTPQENGVINGFHSSPTALQDRRYLNSGGSINCQMNAPSSNGNKYNEIGTSNPKSQHVRPRRLEALHEEEESFDDRNCKTDENMTNNEIPSRSSTNCSLVARIKALFETESKLNPSKDINTKKQLDTQSKHVVGERVFDHLLQDFRKSDSALPCETDQSDGNAGGNNELDSPVLIERFDIDNFELSLSDEEDAYEEVDSPVLKAKPNTGTRPGPLKISPVLEVSPLSSPSSISSLSSFSSVASSTRVSAYSGVDQSQVLATRSLTNVSQAHELLPNSTQPMLSGNSERQNWEVCQNVTQGAATQLAVPNKIAKRGVTQVRSVQPGVTQASRTPAGVAQTGKPDTIQMGSVQPSATQVVATQIRTKQPNETQTSTVTPKKVQSRVTHVGSFQTPVTQGRTSQTGMAHSSATFGQQLGVPRSTCNGGNVGSNQTSWACDKIPDISSQPSAVNLKEQGSVSVVNVTEDINSYSGQSLPAPKHSGATFGLVNSANGNSVQGSRTPSLPRGTATVHVKPPQHFPKPSTVVSSPSVKDQLSAFNNESRVSSKNYSKTNSNQEVKSIVRHLEGRESLSKSESNYFYSSQPTGNVRPNSKKLESSSTKVVSTLKINLSGNNIQEKNLNVAAKPVSATEMKCSVDETLELPLQGKSWFQAQNSTLIGGENPPNSNDTTRNSAKHPLPTKISELNLRKDDTSFASKPKGHISNPINASSIDSETAEQENVRTVRNLSYSTDGPAIGCRPGQQNKRKATKHVSLDPHAVLLDASVEGELDLVKSVIHDVHDPSQPNSDGITALHNAVCGNHGDVVVFLVEFGCDINLPDSHGWTPLHCAAANNNLNIVQYLIDHGACIFATTLLQQKTPSQCCEQALPGYYACSNYLHDVEQNFGLVNDGVVYALYSYKADEKDELSFECGEELHILRRGDNTEKEWWWAENSQGLNSGYVPRNLLGMHPRTAPEV